MKLPSMFGRAKPPAPETPGLQQARNKTRLALAHVDTVMRDVDRVERLITEDARVSGPQKHR